MNPDLIYSLYKFKKLYPENIPSLALELIEKGVENEYLIELAGLSKPSASEIGDLFEKAFNNIVAKDIDLNKMALIFAQAILDKELDPYKGASLIGKISEELENRDDLWQFKCKVIEYDDYEQDKTIHLGYDPKDIDIWQKEILDNILIDSLLLIKRNK